MSEILNDFIKESARKRLIEKKEYEYSQDSDSKDVSQIIFS